MKKIFSFILMASMSVGAFADAFYCDPACVNSSDGTSWENAISPSTLRKEISILENGDTVFFKGGTILITNLADMFKITKSLTFIGGFDPAATGTVTELPKYPSATPTIVSGDANSDGKPNKGDAQALIRVDFSGDTTKMFRLIGFDLINTFYDGEVDSPNDVLTSTAQSAALRMMCGFAEVRNCHFYNHMTPNGRGSQCVTSVGAKLHMTDCELHDAICLSRGSLLRSRQYFPNGDTTKAINPDCVVERCCFYNGSNMGGDTLNTGGFYGGAVQISYGPFFAINSTFVNNKGYSDGGCVNCNQSGGTFISCTFVNNKSMRAYNMNDVATSRNSYGSSLHISKNGVMHLANNIIVAPNDNGSKQYAVLYSDNNTNEMQDNVASAGYNITGTYFYYKNNSQVNDQSAVWEASDKWTTIDGTTVQKMEDYFNMDSLLIDEGFCSKVTKPMTMQKGDNVAHLQQMANAWCPSWTSVNAGLDQRGMQRDASVTGIGAYAHEAVKPTALETVQSSIINQQSSTYNLLGQPVGADYKGIIIQKGKKYLVQ